MNLKSKLIGTLLAASVVMGYTPSALADTSLQFYFPVAVGGIAADTIDALTKDYVSKTPGVKIDAVYAGSYQDTITKALTAVRGGNPPQLSVITSPSLFTLIDEDAIIAIEDLVTTDEERAWLKGFYPAFMENSTTGGKIYSVPFQRSTPVLYYNKEAFKKAGLDPNKPPATWDEMVEYGKKLTLKDASGKVTQWGVRIPSSGFPYWLFQALCTENDTFLMNGDGNETYFDKPGAIEALQYMVDLSKKHKVMAPGVNEWGTTPKAFFEGETAMMWTTTGNLTNVRKNAPFDFGVAMLPAKKRRGAGVGGGNFYIFKGSSDEQNKASLEFLKWITAPEQAARWTIATGYIAPRADAWETQTMKDYVKDFPPALVAKKQLEFATAEFSTHENLKVTKILNDALLAAITGTKTPEKSLQDAQKKAEKVLKAYR